MVVSGWILLATAAVVVCVVVFLSLVIRRALTELFFWRGAYRSRPTTRAHCSGKRTQGGAGTAAERLGAGPVTRPHRYSVTKPAWRGTQ